MKKIFTIMLCLLLCFGFVACGGNEEEPADETNTVKLFYAHSSYIETGDESEGMLHKYEITYYPAKPGVVPTPLEIVGMLRKVPKDAEGIDTAVNDKYKINSIEVVEGTAIVDVSSEDLTGGSLEETLFVRQIVETLVNTFDDIQQVKFTVDGEDVDTLMGHLDTSEPFVGEYVEGQQ